MGRQGQSLNYEVREILTAEGRFVLKTRVPKETATKSGARAIGAGETELSGGNGPGVF